ncbi:hypothetical protein CDAR_166791 [Caerostris darwini]|uniref:Ycf1 n=1 Tax=Caerostris darwini TaxID=1538125 RepID=A0AAV4T0T4_9ARAC|nr:hypothetical protein CDAR_403631 [Caerostris darwini]GIY56175.1 hypothetical protein CDAR_166791 [Caerostris darwini]
MSWAKHVTLHPVMPNNFGLYIPLPSQQESFKQLKISSTDYKAEDHSMHSSDAKLSPFIHEIRINCNRFLFRWSNRANLDYSRTFENEIFCWRNRMYRSVETETQHRWLIKRQDDIFRVERTSWHDTEDTET